MEYRRAFYPINEAFTGSLKLLLQVNDEIKRSLGFLRIFFTPACDLYRRIFCPCEVGSLQQLSSEMSFYVLIRNKSGRSQGHTPRVLH